MLQLPASTVRSWTRGRKTRTATSRRTPRPLILTPKGASGELSFTNLVELHVLSSLRQRRLPLQTIRRALAYVETQLSVPHPLAREVFQTDGVDLFVERCGALINANKSGQLEWKELLTTYLSRVECDETGLAQRFFPFTRSGKREQPTTVVVDARIAFGRPVVAGTGIPTAMISERWKAGESLEDLCLDTGCDASQIQEALRCEFAVAA